MTLPSAFYWSRSGQSRRSESNTRKPNRANRKTVLSTRISCGIIVCMDTPLPHTGPDSPLENDDLKWCERSRHWVQRGSDMRPRDKRVRRRRTRGPLILAGDGVSLRSEAGTLFIRNGFSHYPQKQETYRFFKSDADLPPRIIMLDGSGNITFDVLVWLNEQRVSLIRIDWTGNTVTVVSG